MHRWRSRTTRFGALAPAVLGEITHNVSLRRHPETAHPVTDGSEVIFPPFACQDEGDLYSERRGFGSAIMVRAVRAVAMDTRQTNFVHHRIRRFAQATCPHAPPSKTARHNGRLDR